MPQLSLTDFVDIVSKAGRPKATRVRQVRERPEYAPAFDFYKPFREHVIDIHRRGQGRSELSGLLSTLTDPKKIRNYPELLGGYKKWWGRKTLEWFEPPRSAYSFGGIEIIVNPELGLRIDGVRHIVKLYMKTDSLSAFKVELINDLLEHQLRSGIEHNDKLGVLAIRSSKLYADGPHTPSSMPIVNAEIAYISSIWNQ